MAFIELKQASVVFSVYGASARSLKSTLLAQTTGGRIGANSRDHVTIQALDSVSLRLQHGERLGLVGHNGAGKSTLLRLMAGIFEPTGGQLLIEGRVAPIFDIGGGMDWDSTGYENIILRGLALGLSRSEIGAKRDEIAEFTELGAFLEMPLRTYSAGMQARLAFSISTSIEPDILLIDEAVGAGDAAFLQKAEGRLDELAERAGILVLASHVEQTIRRLCTRAAMLAKGRLVAVGPVEEVLERYDHPDRAYA